MKNIVLSAVAVAAMSTFALAGGDIAPIEEPTVVVPEVIEEVTDAGLYIGLGYGYLNTTADVTFHGANGIDSTLNLWDDSFGEVMIQGGYKFNSYVAVEGRYWFGVSDGSWLNTGGTSGAIGEEVGDLSFDAYGIYIKPMFPVADGFNIYALLGYAGVDSTLDGDNNWEDDVDVDGFSWGIGAEYAFSPNVSVFVDYTVLYDSDSDEDTLNYGNVNFDMNFNVIDFGVTYKF